LRGTPYFRKGKDYSNSRGERRVELPIVLKKELSGETTPQKKQLNTNNKRKKTKERITKTKKK